MRGKGNQNHQEEDEYEEEDLAAAGSRKDGGVGGAPSSTVSATTSNSANNNTNRDGKNSDKASAVRSKHSVTEQRRRSKINERFQILRELVPQCDQKKDTASFLMEVIEYVRFLQEKVQKYEGPYQGWPAADPAKLMPWRNSHWQVQSLLGHPQAISNGSGIGPMFPGKLDENGCAFPTSVLTSLQNVVEPDPLRDAAIGQQTDIMNKDYFPHLRPPSDPQTSECPLSGDSLSQREELVIEGGTINISSAYSEALLNALTQALQTAGVDLSQASISLQIDLGKRSNRDSNSADKDNQNPISSNQTAIHLRDGTGAGQSDQVNKRLKM